MRGTTEFSLSRAQEAKASRLIGRQDQNASIKRQLYLLLPGVSIFLDVDDLESIDALEEYIDQSQVVQFFCSKGYFKSANCLREVRTTLQKGKRFTLMADPEKGGAPLEVIKNEECPVDLRGRVFDGRTVTLFYRIAEFRVEGLKELAEQVILGCPNYAADTSLPLYIPGEITLKKWGFRPPATIYCSPNNPGAKEAVEAIKAELTAAACTASEPSWMNIGAATAPVELNISTAAPSAIVSARAPSRGRGHHFRQTRRTLLVEGVPEASHFVLYLSKNTWVGDAGARLATEVVNARAAGFPIVMLHSTPDNDDGCESRAALMAHRFGHFFASTPNELIQDGLYKPLALAIYPGVFHHVSACLVARALGASDLPETASSKVSWLVRRASTSLKFNAKGGKAPGSSTVDSTPASAVAPTVAEGGLELDILDDFLPSEPTIGQADDEAGTSVQP